MAFRTNLVTPVTWSVIVLFFGWPVVALPCLPVLHYWGETVFGYLTGFLVLLWLVGIWAYFRSLVVTIKADSLIKHSFFGTTSVLLNENTLIRHRAERLSIHGVDISSGLAPVLGEEATTHLQITVRNGRHQIKIGSSLKGVVKLRSHLIDFELQTILPAIQKRLRSNGSAAFAPFLFAGGKVALGGSSENVPLAVAPGVSQGYLTIAVDRKVKKIAFKKVWNAVTCLHLLSEGVGASDR